MQNTKFNPKLTILIPTRNRAKYIGTCLKRIIRSIKYYQNNGGTENIEIVIANNFSSDNTEEIVLSFAQNYEYIKYYKHKEFYKSAEESLFNAIELCHGDYIWSFGDDDYMRIFAISETIKIINTNKYDLIVHNIEWLKKTIYKNFRYSYIPIKNGNINNKIPSFSVTQNYDRASSNKIKYIEYKTSKMFLDLGFWNITTSFASICFKNNKFNKICFEEAIKISTIYSYSISLFISFFKSKSLLVCKPLVLMTENTSSGEFNRISAIAIENNLMPRYSWTYGFIRLIKFASNKTKLPLEIFFNSRETALSRENYISSESFVLNNILHSFLIDIKSYKIKLQNKEKLSIAVSDYVDLLQNIINNFPELTIFLQDLQKIKKYLQLSDKYFLYLIHIFINNKIKKKISKLYLPSLPKLKHDFESFARNKIDLEGNISLNYGIPKNII
ncbi:MAG: glycosyltransferase [Rickettsiales bacterium]|nr:glycosyltransferase [Rickettsiales bacterium]